MSKDIETLKASNYLSQGNKHQQQGNIDQSLNSYQKAIDINPNLIPALSKLAEIYNKQKEYDKAANYYLKIVSLRPKKQVFFQKLVKALLDYSKLLLKKNNLDKAIATYKELITHKPLHNVELDKIDRICNILGGLILKLSVRKGEFTPAITFFQKAIDDYPYKEWSYYQLGNIFAKQDKLDEAIVCYEKVVAIRPEFYQSILKLGELFLRKGRRNKAFQCGLKILQSQGHFKNGKFNNALNKLLTVHSNPKKSQELLQQAIEEIEISSSNLNFQATTYRNIGKILRDQDKLDEAIDFYQKSLYLSLQKSRSEFVSHYWEQGRLKEPDFLVIGFGKCGTTAFYDYLCQHPFILPAVEKEPFYLSKLVRKTKNFEERDWSLPSSEKDLYLAHFAPRPEKKHFITGEASTGNIVPGCEKIISSWFPKIKLIALLREPVRRTISHYEERLKIDKQRGSLEEVINSELEELEEMTAPAKTTAKLLKRRGWNAHIPMSLYVYPLERWMNLFPREQFLILTNEDLAQYPAETMKQAFEFLELPECKSIEYHPRNVGAYPQVDTNLLSSLSDFFRPHNQRLEEFLGRKFHWDDN